MKQIVRYHYKEGCASNFAQFPTSKFMRFFNYFLISFGILFMVGCQKHGNNVSEQRNYDDKIANEALSISNTQNTSNNESTKISELANYTQCKFSDGLEIVQTDRLEPRPKYRSVETAEGSKRILMLDGYRLLLAYPQTRYFANLKVEKSDTSFYLADKQAVIDSLKQIHSQGVNVNRQIINKNFKGFDLYGLDNPVIDIDGPIGMYLLFKDSQQTIVSIYFLNQNPDFRKFQSYGEYEQLKDKFLDEFVGCANAAGNTL